MLYGTVESLHASLCQLSLLIKCDIDERVVMKISGCMFDEDSVLNRYVWWGIRRS